MKIEKPLLEKRTVPGERVGTAKNRLSVQKTEGVCEDAINKFSLTNLLGTIIKNGCSGGQIDSVTYRQNFTIYTNAKITPVQIVKFCYLPIFACIQSIPYLESPSFLHIYSLCTWINSYALAIINKY